MLVFSTNQLLHYGTSGQEFCLILSFLKNDSLTFPTAVFQIHDLRHNFIYITIYADNANLFSKCGSASDLWQQLELASKTYKTKAGSGLLISMLEKVNLFHLSGLITLMLLKWK